MNFLIKYLSAGILCLSSHYIFAELRVVETHLVAVGGHRDTKLISNHEGVYWVTAHPLGEMPLFQVDDFFTGRSVGRVIVDINRAPIFMPQGHQDGLLMTANVNAEWSAVRLNKQSNRAEKYTELKSFLSATETAKFGSKFAIAGMSKDDMPLIVLLGRDFNVQHELIWRSKIKGQISSIFSIAEKLYAVVSFYDFSSELWELSQDLSIVKVKKLLGGAATGIPMKDGGIAITYSKGKDKFDVFVEKFDSNFKSIWLSKIIVREGIGTPRYVLCELLDGLGLVGANNNHLVIARIAKDGSHFRLIEDKLSGLSSPASQGYSVGVLHNNIHARGLAVNDDGSWTSFHFVERTMP